MSLGIWIGFAVFVLLMLALDLGVFHRRARSLGLEEALGWTAVWVALAFLFGAGIAHFWSPQKAVEFYTGYLIELSLSADNVFVFVLLFAYFAVPARFQHEVLFWGVLGALVMRLLMIGLGVSLLHRFSWIFYLVGAFLIFTGARLAFARGKALHPEQNPVIRWFTRLVPVTREFHGARFLVRLNGKATATPLLVTLLGIEASDVVFATDSIPAIFGVTLDPFIVYTSNVFAILGLRSMYFVLARAIDKFYYLRPALGLVLGFVGVKMFLGHTAYRIATGAALGVVAVILAAALLASWVRARKRRSH